MSNNILPENISPIITLDEKQIKSIEPLCSVHVADFIPFLNKGCAFFGIDTNKRMAMFIAQILHESGGFHYTKELASGSAYDTGKLAIELGNTPGKDGDGEFYKGRGLIQITGKANYSKVSMALFNDNRLLTHPEILESPEYASLSACWYWKSHNLNKYADTSDLKSCTRIINGGLNGYNKRLSYWLKAKKVLSVS